MTTAMWFKRMVPALASGFMLALASPAESATVWRILVGPRSNNFLGVSGGKPALTRSIGSGVFSDSQHWVLRRVGGTITAPEYQIYNYENKLCLDSVIPNPGLVERIPLTGCGPGGGWRFQTPGNQTVNPGLVQSGTAAREYRIRARSVDAYPWGYCLVVPFSRFVEGTQVGVQRPCATSPNHRWWLFRDSKP